MAVPKKRKSKRKHNAKQQNLLLCQRLF
jgi:ribosomal protein L32